MEQGQLVIRLKTAKAIRVQDLKITALETVIKTMDHKIFEMYQKTFEALKQHDEDLIEIEQILESVRKSQE